MRIPRDRSSSIGAGSLGIRKYFKTGAFSAPAVHALGNGSVTGPLLREPGAARFDPGHSRPHVAAAEEIRHTGSARRYCGAYHAAVYRSIGDPQLATTACMAGVNCFTSSAL